MTPTPHNGDEEFVTIVGGDAEQIGRAFQAEGLAGKDLVILHLSLIHI